MRFKFNAWIVSSLLVVTFFVAVPWYVTDGPNHKHVAVVLSRLAQSPDEAAVYKNNLSWQQTNILFPLLYQRAHNYLSIDLYEKLFVILCLFSLSLSYRYFLEQWEPKNRSLWVLILPFYFYPSLMRGLYNYMASVPLIFLALALVKKKQQFSYFLFLLVCCLAYLAHPVSLMIILIFMFLFWLIDPDFTWKSLSLYGLPPTVIFIKGFVLSLLQATQEKVETPYGWMSTLEALGGLFDDSFATYGLLHILAVMPFFLFLVWLGFISIRRPGGKKKIFWLAMLGCYFFFPKSGDGGAHLNERFLLFMWAFIPLGLLLSPREEKWTPRVLFLGFLVVTLYTAQGMFKVEKYAQDFRRVLKDIPSKARLYPIIFSAYGPADSHGILQHFWALFDQKKIIYSPYFFAFRELNPINKRHRSSETYFPATTGGYPEEVRRQDYCERAGADEVVNCDLNDRLAFDKIFRNSSYYDYWLLHDPPEHFLKHLKHLEGIAHLSMVAHSGKTSLWYYSDAKLFDPKLP